MAMDGGRAVGNEDAPAHLIYFSQYLHLISFVGGTKSNENGKARSETGILTPVTRAGRGSSIFP